MFGSGVPLFLSAEKNQGEPLLADGNPMEIDEELLKKARRLSRIEDLIAMHKRNKRITLAFMTVALLLLFITEIAYSIGVEQTWQLTLLK